jgi:hypothetical protein
VTSGVSSSLPACPTRPPRPRRNDVHEWLIRFTNCLQLKEDGALLARDLWIDERRGVVLDVQVRRRAVGRRAVLTRARGAASVDPAQGTAGAHDRPQREHPLVRRSLI